MEKTAQEHNLANENGPNLERILRDHIDISRTSSLSGPRARPPLLLVELLLDAKAVKLQLQEFAHQQ